MDRRTSGFSSITRSAIVNVQEPVASSGGILCPGGWLAHRSVVVGRYRTPCDGRSGVGPSAKFLAPAKKCLVIGVLQTRFSHLEFFAF